MFSNLPSSLSFSSLGQFSHGTDRPALAFIHRLSVMRARKASSISASRVVKAATVLQMAICSSRLQEMSTQSSDPDISKSNPMATVD